MLKRVLANPDMIHSGYDVNNTGLGLDAHAGF